MQAIDFILETLAHFARRDDGPPPGVPVNTEGDFERELMWLCEWHGITPVVLASLEKLALRPHLSRITIERMKALDRASRNLSEEMLDTTHALADAFAARETELRVLGDVALATMTYGEAGLRTIERIELLVAEMRWSSVLDACRSVGFRTDAPLPLFRNGVNAMHYFQYFPPCVLDNERGDRLHLRLRLFGMGEPEVAERAWERRRKLTGSLDGVAGTSREDQLIHSALEYNITGFGRLIHAVDIALVLSERGDAIDWGYVEDRLMERNTWAAFCSTLQNVVRWLKLPPGALPFAGPGPVRRRIFDLTWPAGRNAFAIRRGDGQHRLKFCLMESGTVREKLAFLHRMLSPRREWVTAFFRRPYRPWLKLKFVILVLRSRVGIRTT